MSQPFLRMIFWCLVTIQCNIIAAFRPSWYIHTVLLLASILFGIESARYATYRRHKRLEKQEYDQD